MRWRWPTRRGVPPASRSASSVVRPPTSVRCVSSVPSCPWPSLPSSPTRCRSGPRCSAPSHASTPSWPLLFVVRYVCPPPPPLPPSSPSAACSAPPASFIVLRSPSAVVLCVSRLSTSPLPSSATLLLASHFSFAWVRLSWHSASVSYTHLT